MATMVYGGSARDDRTQSTGIDAYVSVRFGPLGRTLGGTRRAPLCRFLGTARAGWKEVKLCPGTPEMQGL